jgi:multiple sugar transport system permease protein/putative aldouronate transport system permease protein
VDSLSYKEKLMAKTAQERADEKAERLYYKKHKKPGRVTA